MSRALGRFNDDIKRVWRGGKFVGGRKARRNGVEIHPLNLGRAEELLHKQAQIMRNSLVPLASSTVAVASSTVPLAISVVALAS